MLGYARVEGHLFTCIISGCRFYSGTILLHMQQLAHELLTNKAARGDQQIALSAMQTEFNPWHTAEEM